MFVTLHPGSSTNPTGKFWVVDYADWQRCVNNNHIERITPVRQFDNYADAEKFRDTANRNAEMEDH